MQPQEKNKTKKQRSGKIWQPEVHNLLDHQFYVFNYSGIMITQTVNKHKGLGLESACRSNKSRKLNHN